MSRLQNFEEWMEEKFPELERFVDRRVGVLFAAALMLFSGYMLLDNEDVQTRYFIDNTTELQYIEDNRLGSNIIHNRANHPVIHSTDSLKACIYTDADREPVVTDISEEKKILLRSNEIRSSGINLTLPEDQLSRNGLNQEMPVEKMDRCPVRSEPRIILTGRK